MAEFEHEAIPVENLDQRLAQRAADGWSIILMTFMSANPGEAGGNALLFCVFRRDTQP